MRLSIFVVLATAWLGTAQAAGLADGLATSEVMKTAGPYPITLAKAEQAAVTCPPAGDAVVAEGPLANVRRALQPGDKLDILAVGSATVLGPDGDQPEAGFPYRMAQMLKLAAPQTDVTVTLRGGRGQTAETMGAALDDALSTHSYQLVLWQTGTVEAVKRLPPEALYNTILKKAEVLREKTDLILVDPQFSRFLRANTDITPYENVLEKIATLPGVTLFHRFELMRIWADRGTLDLERAAPADRKPTNLLLHACLGRTLARMVLAGAGMHAAK
jgi:hypothetical protein